MTRANLILAIGLGCLIILLFCVSGTTTAGPWLGQAYDIRVTALILVSAAAGAAIAGAIAANGSQPAPSPRAGRHDTAGTILLILIVLSAAAAASRSDNPLAAGLVAVFLGLASVAALRCIDLLGEGNALGFESHWGGLGGSGGGWRLLPASALALLALAFAGSAAVIGFGTSRPGDAPAATAVPSASSAAATKAAPRPTGSTISGSPVTGASTTTKLSPPPVPTQPAGNSSATTTNATS